MEELFKIYIIIAIIISPIIIIIDKIITKNKEKKHQQQKNSNRITEIEETKVIHDINPIQKIEDYKNKYQKKLLLTKNELHEWRKLQHYCNERNLFVCPKVRLLDIIEPKKSITDYMAMFGKIKSKHVDFVISDHNMIIKGIIELDDSSHFRQDRIKRDEFVDEILTNVGYKIIHTFSITEKTLEFLDE